MGLRSSPRRLLVFFFSLAVLFLVTASPPGPPSSLSVTGEECECSRPEDCLPETSFCEEILVPQTGEGIFRGEAGTLEQLKEVVRIHGDAEFRMPSTETDFTGLDRLGVVNGSLSFRFEEREEDSPATVLGALGSLLFVNGSLEITGDCGMIPEGFPGFAELQVIAHDLRISCQRGPNSISGFQSLSMIRGALNVEIEALHFPFNLTGLERLLFVSEGSSFTPNICCPPRGHQYYSTILRARNECEICLMPFGRMDPQTGPFSTVVEIEYFGPTTLIPTEEVWMFWCAVHPLGGRGDKGVPRVLQAGAWTSQNISFCQQPLREASKLICTGIPPDAELNQEGRMYLSRDPLCTDALYTPDSRTWFQIQTFQEWSGGLNLSSPVSVALEPSSQGRNASLQTAFLNITHSSPVPGVQESQERIQNAHDRSILLTYVGLGVVLGIVLTTVVVLHYFRQSQHLRTLDLIRFESYPGRIVLKDKTKFGGAVTLTAGLSLFVLLLSLLLSVGLNDGGRILEISQTPVLGERGLEAVRRHFHVRGWVTVYGYTGHSCSADCHQFQVGMGGLLHPEGDVELEDLYECFPGDATWDSAGNDRPASERRFSDWSSPRPEDRLCTFQWECAGCEMVGSAEWRIRGHNNTLATRYQFSIQSQDYDGNWHVLSGDQFAPEQSFFKGGQRGLVMAVSTYATLKSLAEDETKHGTLISYERSIPQQLQDPETFDSYEGGVGFSFVLLPNPNMLQVRETPTQSPTQVLAAALGLMSGVVLLSRVSVQAVMRSRLQHRLMKQEYQRKFQSRGLDGRRRSGVSEEESCSCCPKLTFCCLYLCSCACCGSVCADPEDEAVVAAELADRKHLQNMYELGILEMEAPAAAAEGLCHGADGRKRNDGTEERRRDAEVPLL